MCAPPGSSACGPGYLRDNGDPGSFAETMLAKYFASTAATKVATDAVQIHGGNGCTRTTRCRATSATPR